MIALLPPVVEDPQLTKTIRELEVVRSSWAASLRINDQYLRGEQPLAYMSDAMRKEFGDEITALVLNFPELVVDAHNDRLDVEGFRFPGEPSGDSRLWEIWQANNLDEQSEMGHLDALGLSKAAIIVGAGESAADLPVVTIESALDVAWIRDPKSGAVVRAMKRWAEADGSQWATLYEPRQNRVVVQERGIWRDARPIDAHGLGRVQLVPLVNRPRVKYRDGRSEFASVLTVANAANKMATDMMISGEYHAMPRRWAFGLKSSDFRDKNGNPKSAWSVVKGRLWANESKDVKVGQFPEADLRNFHETIKLLVRLVGLLTAMPIDYVSFDSVNPPSADALRSAESRLVKRVERRQRSFGGSWEEAMRLALRISEGSFRPEAMSLETVWREASTPTVAQVADAVVKKFQAGIIPRQQAWIDLGYSPAQRAEMERMLLDEAQDPFLVALTAKSANAGVGG